jgi:large conductance mechanosensitive channel
MRAPGVIWTCPRHVNDYLRADHDETGNFDAVQQGGFLLKEFRDFINRGNLIDLAVAFVLAVAFAGVVSALTEGIVTPLIGRIFSVEGLQDWIVARDIQLGAFLAALINFVVVAFVMFMVIKAYNRMKRPAETAADAEEIILLREIRDSLRRP